MSDEIATFSNFADSGKITKSAQNVANHEVDFEPPIYNIWKQQTKSEGSSHFGNSESRWFDNLLYLYTKPLDVVIDPFAGGLPALCRFRCASLEKLTGCQRPTNWLLHRT